MLKVTIPNVTQHPGQLLTFELPPHQVRMLGKCDSAVGARSVVLIEDAVFDPSRRELAFSVEDVVALNIGSTASTVAILSKSTSEIASAPAEKHEAYMSKGDKGFIELSEELLHPPMQKAAAALLAGVRQRSPGELKRGKSYNFSETPDNFWYVIVQPRVQQLSITVRGPVSLFSGVTHLPVKDDRGNTLFKITGEQDIDAALKLIFRAKRKD